MEQPKDPPIDRDRISQIARNLSAGGDPDELLQQIAEARKMLDGDPSDPEYNQKIGRYLDAREKTWISRKAERDAY